MTRLLDTIQRGMPNTSYELDPDLREYHQHRHDHRLEHGHPHPSWHVRWPTFNHDAPRGTSQNNWWRSPDDEWNFSEMVEGVGHQTPSKQCLFSTFKQQGRDSRQVVQENAPGLHHQVRWHRQRQVHEGHPPLPQHTPPGLQEVPGTDVFGRTLRDHVPCLPYRYAPSAGWCVSQELRERMLAKTREINWDKLSRSPNWHSRGNPEPDRETPD